MKKISLFIVAILLIIPFTVSAAEAEYKVVELNASNDSTTIKYDGTMEAGSTAVKCWLYEGTTELNYYSSAVDNTKFNGTFTVSKNGEYTVKCANYEGGELKEATVKVEDIKEDETTPATDEAKKDESSKKETSKKSKNPKTGDNILLYTSLMIISLLGIGLVTFKLKENK